MKKIIYLTGFMGAGKSTVGPILANTLGWNFIDLDKMIEQKAGKKIKDIFLESGEAYFRKMEKEILREISSEDNLVISLGGGTAASENNLSFIKTKGTVIYLKTSVEAVFKRIINKNDRPMIKVEGSTESDEEILERVKGIFKQREPFYDQADFTVDTENIPVGRTVDYLARLLNNLNKGKD